MLCTLVSLSVWFAVWLIFRKSVVPFGPCSIAEKAPFRGAAGCFPLSSCWPCLHACVIVLQLYYYYYMWAIDPAHNHIRIRHTIMPLTSKQNTLQKDYHTQHHKKDYHITTTITNQSLLIIANRLILVLRHPFSTTSQRLCERSIPIIFAFPISPPLFFPPVFATQIQPKRNPRIPAPRKNRNATKTVALRSSFSMRKLKHNFYGQWTVWFQWLWA